MEATTTAPQASPNGSTRPSSASRSNSERTRLERAIASIRHDPLAFVLFAFPWGTGELAGHEGPDTWQQEILAAVRDRSMNLGQAIQIAIASGHGPGKSALVAWLLLWAMTRPDTRGVVTANTEVQLKTKTWSELAKWYRLCICRDWWIMTATALYAQDPNHERTWRIDMVPWSETNTEAFAGLHNHGKRIIVVFDEASAIPDTIWETTEGALTDAETEIIWLVCGNPTRNTGRFRECFGRFRHRWLTWQIDSRTARLTNKPQIERWVQDYGEDSDFVRIRVRGVFPRAGSQQFISSEVVEEAASDRREAAHGLYDPRIMGVDVARFGDDQTVIRFRIGRDARSIPPVKLRGLDTMQIAARIVEEARRHRIDAIFVDGGGVGGGVVDQLRYLRQPVTEVQFGAVADRSRESREGNVVYYNKRAEMWGLMRDWLNTGAIDNDPELIADLTSVEYGYALKDGRDAIQLERKSDMRKRGLASPDNGDALALTFAYPVAPSDHSFEFNSSGQHEFDYDPFAWPDLPAVAPSPQPYYEPSPSRFGNGLRHRWYDK
jgi:hypothetical protein